MALKVGDTAPDFTLQTQDDKPWKLSEQRGKNVVLLWYPLDWSPTCEKEHCSLTSEETLSAPGAVVVGISRDSVWSHKAFRKERKIAHELLADPMLETTKLYGLVHPKVPFISHRATVIVDKKGKVAFTQIQEKTAEPRDMGAVAAALERIS
jgi:peroxiredoxin